MALKTNYNLQLYYTLGDYGNTEDHKEIFTEAQLKELALRIEKKITIQDTYCKINKINGCKDNINITLCVYKNHEKNAVIESRLYCFHPNIDDGAGNFIKQGYEYLKTLPEYADAIDC